MVSIPINFSLFLLWCLAKILLLLFISPRDKKVTPEFYTKLTATEKAFGAMIMTMPNKYGTIFKDVERIFEKIRKKERIA